MKQRPSCPVQTAVDIIGGKWKILLIYHLLSGTKRFGELRRLIPGITQKMLTQQLRELEDEAIVHRRVYPQVPPKVEYSLTALGRSLDPVFTLLCAWGQGYLRTAGRKARPGQSRSAGHSRDHAEEYA
jgi:DNA-binding HxlR family transcriptional regulator